MAGGEDGIADEVGAVQEEDVLYSETANRGGESKGGEGDPSLRTVMRAAVPVGKWRAEVERVAPRLRFKPALSGREWRTHLEATVKHQGVLAALFPGTHSSLERIGADVGGMVERVRAKERHINSSFQALAGEYKGVQEQQEGAAEAHKAASEAVAELTNELAVLGDDLEELGGQLEDRGASITDSSPLVRIKAALSALRGEMRGMDTRVGVLGHRLMQHKLAAGLARAGKTRAGGRAEEGGDGGDSEGDLDIEDGEV